MAKKVQFCEFGNSFLGEDMALDQTKKELKKTEIGKHFAWKRLEYSAPHRVRQNYIWF